jgi:N-acetylglutamate synthase-like GNAT family acetyltransferase
MEADPATIRPARLAERDALERLQRRSSVHDPMYRAQLAAHPDAIVGFAVLLERSGDACELDGLFVEPDRMRAGVGRGLVEDAKRIARERGATRIDVVANPQAVAFYAAVGFAAVGEAQTRFGPASRMSLSIAR